MEATIVGYIRIIGYICGFYRANGAWTISKIIYTGEETDLKFQFFCQVTA